MNTKRRLVRMRFSKTWYLLNIVEDPVSEKRFVSLLDHDLIIQSPIGDNMGVEPFHIIPNNVAIVKDLARNEKNGYGIEEKHKTSYINVFHIVRPLILRKEDFMYKILFDLSNNDDIDYVIIPTSLASNGDLTLLPYTGKIITYIDMVNRTFFDAVPKRKWYKFFEKDINSAMEKSLINAYNATRYFYIVR